MEDAVLTGNLEAADGHFCGDESRVLHLDGDNGLGVLEFHTLVCGSRRRNPLQAVIIDQCQIGKAVADFQLLRRMDEGAVAQIDRRDHSAPRNQRERLLLGLVEITHGEGPGVIVSIGGDLHEIERCVQVLEPLPHHPDVGGLEADILLRPGAVGLSLIPEDSLEGEGDDRGDHPVVQDAGCGMVLFVNLVLVEERKVEFSGEVFLQNLPGHPGFDAGSAPLVDDEADGDFQDFLQFAGEEVGRRAGPGNHLGRILLPGSFRL